MGNLRFRLQTMLTALMLVFAITASAQNIRYVKASGGDNTKDGLSWATAKKDIQDAINDLVNNNLDGEVWVAAGTYYPTESTESSISQYYKSFKIPAGITVRGGFKTDLTATDDGVNDITTRPLQNDKNFGKAGANSGNLDGEGAKSGVYVNKTILSGDVTGKKATFTWNPTKQQFDATFYGNSYHVVWFAMNGFNSTTKRANPLAKPAKLEGCVVEGGHAYTRNAIDANVHEGYGGGIYMVANSFVYNCEVRNCDASRNGGGIYMDGGGIVRRTYVHDCQALGIGTEFGLGGGICEDGGALNNSKTNPIVVAQSAVTNCVGRLGGGMALCGDKTTGNAKYSVVANSTLVSNNTAQVEGGGVYTYKGGGLASLTVVNNKCNGSGITQNEVITGRSGGVYSRDASYIGNTVMWGNTCQSNNDVQFATSRTSLNSSDKTHFYCNAVSNMDNTDWSGTEKMGVLSLANTNKKEGTGSVGSKGFPLFFKPTASAGYLSTATTDTDIDWTVSSESFLSYAGISTADLDNEGLTPAPTGKSWDMQFGEFNARPTIGAFISQVVDIKPATNITYEGVKYDYAFFVDPAFIYADDNTGYNGGDWEHPLRFLGNALDFIEDNENHKGPLALGTYNFEGKKVAVFVKEGNVDNTRTWGSSRVRAASLEIPSNVSLFGSFNGQLAGKDLTLQNVVHTPTVINGQLMGNYNYNIAHLINIKDKHDIHIHGFKLSYANASSTALTNDNTDGAAITLINSKDIKFHDIIVSNCLANHGAAVYADKSSAEFENCIFHNNTTGTAINNPVTEGSGIIYATNGSALDFNHCDVLRNVGHASYLGTSTKNHWQNSIFYGNLSQPVGDTNTNDGSINSYAIAAFAGNYTGATGNHCMFDAASAKFELQFGGNDTGNQWQYNLQYTFADGTGKGYPRFINPTKNAGVTEDGDQTYYGRAVSFEPHNNNPIVNMASHADIHTSWGRDLVDVTRDFGGLPDIGAVENHVASQFEEGENAYADGQKPYGEAYYVRDYSSNGTNVPTYSLNSEGHPVVDPNNKGIYNAAGELLDGSSWEYAVNGNGMYDFGGTPAKTYNTVFKTIVTTTPGSFKGTFTIKSGNYYIYLNGTTPALTTKEADATHFEVEGVTTSTMATGTKYIRAKVGTTWYYLYRNSGNANTTTSNKNKITIAAATGGYTLVANGRYYYRSGGSLSTPSQTGSTYRTAWTFTPDMNQDVTKVEEKAYKQDGTTEVTTKKTPGVAADAAVTDHLKFHVYKSLDDYKNSTTQKTYKIKRQASAHYLKNVDNYFYSDATKANGNDFILLQDGDYGKYYIYDVTTQKYIYYYTGTGGTSHVHAGYEADKTTWWIEEPETGVLNFVYGSQSEETDGDYAITVTDNGGVAASVGAQGTADAKFVLVANAAYDVYNYTEAAVDPEKLNGLQYAVNSANAKFSTDQKVRTVSVGKGIYTNKTATDANSVSQPYAYMIKEGVNVYGGFPENGNPGMNERQPKEFETILQPQTASPYITYNRPSVGGGNYSVTVSNWGSSAARNNGSEKTSIGRVLVQPSNFTTATSWDGFTMRYGYLMTAMMNNIGAKLTSTTAGEGLDPGDVMNASGAGVLLQENGILSNCVVKENLILCSPRNANMITMGKHTSTQDANKLYTYHMSGAGIFMSGVLDSKGLCNGIGAIVENCEVNNNQIITKSQSVKPDNVWMYGGGIFQNGGQMYNTIIHDNDMLTVQGDKSRYSTEGQSTSYSNEMILGGVFIASGKFYNNTVVNNVSTSLYSAHNNHCTFCGIHVFDDARIYNSIVADNYGRWYYSGGTSPGNGVPVSAFADGASSRESRDASKIHITYSFVDVKKGETGVDLVSQNDTGNTNVYLNTAQGGAAKTITSDKVYHKNGATGTTAANMYHIFVDSPAFNSGTEDIANVDIPDYDAEYTDRVKDCRIDMGAYEFNGAAAVAPTVTGNQAVFYVTHNGFGSMTATDPENAACAAKLQIVLDAAGRYKYLNPTKQVIVKVANDWDMLHPNNGTKSPGDDGFIEPEDFTYYATRTTDQTDQDVRVWSIMVPRGVEVWGGYTDVPTTVVNDQIQKASGTWTNSNNGFTNRSITGNPTYFDSYYENKLEHTGANTYHVVTFTDRIFDQNGLAYTKKDFEGKDATQVENILSTGAPSTYVELPGNDETLFAHMSEALPGCAGISGNVILGSDSKPKQIAGNYASNRAVIDGIFVSGGQADAPTSGNSSSVNINSYGGAALVNDFAYVRNCILTGNTAINGGALALTDKALVSGCLIMDNEAHNAGGGIYVFENGTKLSNGTTVNTTADTGQQMDINMPHVFTSTIVNNTAQQGGGIWFTEDVNSNARFNSVAVWQNTAADQSNVYGMVNPEQPTDDETLSEIFYPFSFSLIQNVRASGTNNLDAMPHNHEGVRFVNKNHDIGTASVDQTNIAEEKSGDDVYADFGYYGLTTYSMLCSNGMPKSYYEELKRTLAIADNDFMGQPRVDNINNFVEIGARTLPKRMPSKQLMLRLFVAHPDVVDTETATRFMRLNGEAGTSAGYYSQMGSSFAYPFNFLQDALDYITRARNGQIAGLKLNDGTTVVTSDMARNLPFEIILGSGTYYPRQSLNGGTESVWAHTFAIPEGVTIIGGFNPQGGGGTYYGRYYKKGTIADETTGDIYTYVTPIPETSITPGGTEVGRGNKFGSEEVTLPAVAASAEHAAQDEKPITFQQWHIQDIADRRAMADNNKNGIIEPWEFANQTIISGNAVNGETDGVYHIMTAVADADAVGNLPKIQKTYKQGTGKDFVGEGNVSQETGYQWHEEGQQIRLNGLIVTGGNALTYLSTALDDYGSYMFYHGAGLVVDGNRYKKDIDAPSAAHTNPEFHNSAAYGVGYRDIPVSVTNCQFRNNVAGYGGAISSNGSLSLFASAFEQNKALGQTEKPKKGETWTSWIGDENHSGSGTSVTEVSYPGHGGAIHVTNQLSAFNTLFANNEACLAEGETPTIELVQHPTFRVPNKANASATLRAAGGAIMMGSAAQHHIVNCDFVRNKANAYPAVFTMNPTVQQNTAADAVVDTHDYSQIINTVAWGNEVNAISSDANYLRASKLMVNIGKKDRTTQYITDNTKKDFYDPSFANGNVPTDADLANLNAEANTDWQEAAWFCAYEEGVGFKPNNTNDLREAIVYSPKKYAPTMIAAANGDVYQNCNLLIVAENGDVAGPNFGYPSVKAGFDGFMEGADWSPSRFNRLTDNGNGWIKQTVEAQGNDYVVTFHNDDKVDEKIVPGTNFQGAYPITHYISELTPEKQFPEYKLWLSLGNEKYMEATNDQEAQELFINGTSIGRPQKNLPRISPDPTLGVEKAYIDIGVYEYVKQPLLKPGSEVDILWVSTKEKPENGPANGLTWKTPTSDLQGAIEALLSSRNGHKKEIRIMEGEYAPVTPQTVNSTKYNAFVIDTKSLNERAITPTGFTDGSNNDQYYAQSITIKGGYSSEIPYDYDPVKYKTVIRQTESLEGANTDYLIYVADPTLRYAGTHTTDNGAVFSQTGDHESNTAKTMPIQIDGVTLINDKAAAGVSGSAINYPDVTPVSAHSVSVGGQVKYYPNKTEFNKKDANGNHNGTTCTEETEFAEITTTGAETITDPAKIVITKAHIIGSGKSGDANNGSAVYIGQNGGSALIYNTVFHSNYGMPLNAYNTININNTFGLNAGKVQLNGDNSEMHNSALWKNNGGNTQVYFGAAVATGSAKFSFNSYTGATNNDTYHLTSLADVNNNIGEGPNFVDPENDDIEARNFDLKPSMKLLNKGSLTIEEGHEEGIYYDKIMHYNLGASKYAKYDYALIPTTDVDVLNRPRFKNNIDLGAYEFQGSLYGVLYVDPNKSHNDAATGYNWDESFGYGDLQNAMDLAAIYHASEDKEAYVFVKGNSATSKDRNTNETLTIRDGVTAYGSIMSNYNDWHLVKDEHDHQKYATIEDYIADMKNQREGVASNAASKTIITGIKTYEFTEFDGNVQGGESTTPALIDGFVVTDPGQPTAPVIDVTNKSQNAVIVLRNILVADNDLSKAAITTNAAQITNGLIYEALFRDNKMPESSTGAVLKVGNYHNASPEYDTKGYAVNVTVEGKTEGANLDNDKKYPVDGLSTTSADIESQSQIFYSITNSIGSGSGNAAGAAAPYGKITNKHISGYFYNIYDPNLNYQLTETSKYIDACAATNPMSTVDATLAKFINYDTDRDLLGNPRWMRNVSGADLIDRGAFETWKVDKNFVCGKWQIGGAGDYYGTNSGLDDAIAHHFYPHDGSVVYIMKGKSLVIDPLGNDDVKPTPENPGYLLLKEGANFYGNGRPVTAAYVAIERNVRAAGAVVNVPYAMKYKTNVAKSSTTTEDGKTVLQLTADQPQEARYYDGSKRSDWKHIFQKTYNSEDASNCWIAMTSNDYVMTANNGVFYKPNESNGAGTYRFTGKGTSLTDYVYTESTDAFKNVVLTKYDDAESTNHGADYTDEKDMGWNCIGLPWLVSSYETYDDTDATEHGVTGKKIMHIPHEMWLYYDGTTDGNSGKPEGDGGYYKVNSWESTASAWHVAETAAKSIWVGEGIFVQTATLNDTEDLKFYRPVAPNTFAPATLAKRYYFTGVYETNTPEAPAADDAVLVATEFYTADGVHLNTTGTDIKSLPQMPKGTIILMRQHYSNGKTRTQKFTY